MSTRIKIGITVLLALTYFNCYSYVQEISSDTLTLEERVTLLKKYKAENDEQAFFDTYPNDFDCFVAIFGYEDLVTGGSRLSPLYYELEIMEWFFDLSINEKFILNKIVALFQNGYWQADGVNHFRYKSRKLIESNMELVLAELNKSDSEAILGFWHFYYDGPHPKNYKKDYEYLHSKVKALDDRVAALMKQSYEKLLKESDGHGH